MRRSSEPPAKQEGQDSSAGIGAGAEHGCIHVGCWPSRPRAGRGGGAAGEQLEAAHGGAAGRRPPAVGRCRPREASASCCRESQPASASCCRESQPGSDDCSPVPRALRSLKSAQTATVDAAAPATAAAASATAAAASRWRICGAGAARRGYGGRRHVGTRDGRSRVRVEARSEARRRQGAPPRGGASRRGGGGGRVELLHEPGGPRPHVRCRPRLTQAPLLLRAAHVPVRLRSRSGRGDLQRVGPPTCGERSGGRGCGAQREAVPRQGRARAVAEPAPRGVRGVPGRQGAAPACVGWRADRRRPSAAPLAQREGGRGKGGQEGWKAEDEGEAHCLSLSAFARGASSWRAEACPQ
jgi:hypothetical protein